MWFKVDDGLMTHPRVLSIPRKDRMAVIGLWCMAGVWSARELKDGLVPDYLPEELGGTRRQAEALVKAGLWLKIDGGWRFKDWQKWQPTRDDVLQRRKKTADRVRSHRARNAVTEQEEPQEPEDVTALQVRDQRVSNTAPDPTRTNKEHDSLRSSLRGGASEPERTPPDEPERDPERDPPGAELELRSPTDLADRRRPATSPSTPAGIVDAWIDWRGSRPNRRVAGQVLAEVRSLIDDHVDPVHVRQGLAEWSAKSVGPSALPGFVDAVVRRGGQLSRSREITETGATFDAMMDTARLHDNHQNGRS